MSKKKAALVKPDKSELQTANTRFKQDVATLIERKKAMVADVLQYRYEVGQMAEKIMLDANKANKERYYGSNTVEKLAEMLGDSTSTVNLCLKFVRKITQDELKHLQEKGWPWRAVTSILSLESPEARKQFQQDWESGKYSETGSEGLKSDVSEHNQEERKNGKRDDNRGNRSAYLTHVKSAETIVTQAASTTLPEFVHALKELAKHKDQVEEKKLSAIKAHVEGVQKLIPATTQLLAEAEEAIKGVEL